MSASSALVPDADDCGIAVDHRGHGCGEAFGHRARLADVGQRAGEVEERARGGGLLARLFHRHRGIERGRSQPGVAR